MGGGLYIQHLLNNYDLNFWLINQRKYIYQDHLPIKLINDIYKEKNYFWSNDKTLFALLPKFILNNLVSAYV